MGEGIGYPGQIALAVERSQLAEEAEHARVVAETESLRNTLLASISHDLRTPLVSIIGSATSLVTFGDTLSADNRGELLETVRHASLGQITGTLAEVGGKYRKMV